MSAKENDIIKTLAAAIRQDDARKTAPYDTTATVTRIEGGTAWVHIPGGVDETPAELTIAASPGDNVRVRVSGGRAWITGNGSAPPTDDTTAIIAEMRAIASEHTATEAKEIATDAEQEAATAHNAAASAQRSANEAATAAGEAKSSARTANTAANSALTQLSVVEDVVGVLNWISTHGTYAKSTDTEVTEGKMYFTKLGDTYNLVVNPTGNPSEQGYYELSSVDEAVSNYVSSHLSLTDAGLWVVKDNKSYKILLAADGMKVYDADGNLVSTFGESISFSASKAQYIGNDNAYIIFSPATNSINIGGNVTIGGTKTLTEMLNEINAAADKIDDMQERMDSGEFKGEKGDKGDPGAKGDTGGTGATAQWYYGTALTHKSGTATLATSQTSGVVVGSMYLNPDTSLCYKCTAISGTNATWTYAGDLTTGVLENIEIGGRNLLSDTQAFGTKNTTGWYMNGTGSILTSETYQGCKVRSLVNSNVTSNTYLFFYTVFATDAPEVIKLGATYVLSFWAKGTGRVRSYFWGSSGYVQVTSWKASDGTSGNDTEGKKDWTFTSEWQRYWIAYTLKDTGDTSAFKYIGLRQEANLDTSVNIQFCGVKVEIATTPTDWSPAPEDVDEKIETVDGKITNRYGTCGTAAGTAAKVVTLAGFTLFTGAEITVKFTNGNTAATPTLNVNGTGAKNVIINNSTTTTGKLDFPANTTATFTYNGSQWQFTGSDNLENEMTWTASGGLNIRAASGSNSRVNITNSAVDIYDKDGYMRARYSDSVLLGKKEESHQKLDYHSLQLVDKEGATYFYVSDLRDESGIATIKESRTYTYETSSVSISVNSGTVISVTVNGNAVSFTQDPNFPETITFSPAASAGAVIEVTYTSKANNLKAFTFGVRGDGNLGVGSMSLGYQNVSGHYYSYAEGIYNKAMGYASHSEGWNTVASGNASHAEGYATNAYGIPAAHAEGHGTNATGHGTHAEGIRTSAHGIGSHAEGDETQALGDSSHAEGDTTIAYNLASHAEGSSTNAEGGASHAEGVDTIASGFASHAGGCGTRTGADYQTVIGQYNEADSGAAFVVGNGEGDSIRRNAFSADWNGYIKQRHGSNNGYNGKINEDIPGSNVLISGLQRKSFDNENNFYTETYKTSAGGFYTSFVTRAVNSSGTVFLNGFYQQIYANGTYGVTFTNEATKTAWKDGLGIGTVASSVENSIASKSIATSTDTILGSFTLPSAGTWIVMVLVRFGSNATGRRYAKVIGSNSASASAVSNIFEGFSQAQSAYYTDIRMTGLQVVTDSTTRYIVVWQNAGAALSAWARWSAIRIK